MARAPPGWGRRSRAAIAEREPGSRTPTPRASLGLAVFPGDGESFEALLRCADQRLLRVKGNGGPPLAARARHEHPAADLSPPALSANKTHSHYAWADLLEPFQLPFVQRGLVEVLILAVPAGLLGTWIVLRGLAFFSHAVGTAAFPGLVLADGLGFAAPLGAFGAAVALQRRQLPLLGRRRGRATTASSRSSSSAASPPA